MYATYNWSVHISNYPITGSHPVAPDCKIMSSSLFTTMFSNELALKLSRLKFEQCIYVLESTLNFGIFDTRTSIEWNITCLFLYNIILPQTEQFVGNRNIILWNFNVFIFAAQIYSFCKLIFISSMILIWIVVFNNTWYHIIVNK